MSLRLCYGGTFDPVHAGHLAVARAARDACAAAVHWIPAGDPPHRQPPGASALQRARMVELAIAGEAAMALDESEVRASRRSYTVDTLRTLRSALGTAPLAWIVGADAFHGLPDWHEWEALFGLAHWIVAARPGSRLDDLPEALARACAGRWAESAGELRSAPAGRLYRLALDEHPASASELRRRLAAGQDGGDWLPAPVLAYIRSQGLYAPASGSAGL